MAETWENAADWDESEHPRGDAGRFSSKGSTTVASVIDVAIGPDEPVEIVTDGWVAWEGPKREADALVRAQWDEAHDLTGISIHRLGTGPRSSPEPEPVKPTHTAGGWAIPEHPKEGEPGGAKWRDPPAVLYHATLFGPEIQDTGFRPLNELPGSHRVLGGSDTRSMSLTSRENAETYRDGIAVAIHAAQGILPWDRDDAVGVADRFGVSAKEASGLWDETSRKYAAEPEHKRWFEFLQSVSFAGRKFPLFMGGQWPESVRTAKEPPRIVRVEMGEAKHVTYNPSETEWKVADPEKLKVVAVESRSRRGGRWAVAGDGSTPRYVLESESPAKDKPIVLVFGGSFCPPTVAHVAVAEQAKEYMESQGYRVAKVVLAPSADKLLKAKLGDDLIPLAERGKMLEVAIQGHPNLEVATGPGEEAEAFEGKLKRTQLAQWAQKANPEAEVVNVTGEDAAPGHPPGFPSVYQGDPGTSHEGYHYLALPRETGENAVSSSKIRAAYKEGRDIGPALMNPAVEVYYREYMGRRASQEPTGSGDWDESKHPREESGKFAHKGAAESDGWIVANGAPRWVLEESAGKTWLIVCGIPRYVEEKKIQGLFPFVADDPEFEEKHPRGKAGRFAKKGTADREPDEEPVEVPAVEPEKPLAYHRTELPQIAGDDKPAFFEQLGKEGIGVTRESVPAGSLKGIQVDLNLVKVSQMADAIREKGKLGKSALLASADGYIVDGHHRWAAEKQVDPNRMVEIDRVNLPIRELIARIEGYPKSFHVGTDEGAGERVNMAVVKAEQEYKELGTRAPAFKAWFGDWELDPENASKVVDAKGAPKETHEIDGRASVVRDENGQPLVVYHGTAHPGFEVFDPTKKDPTALFGPGFYFTEDKIVAGGKYEKQTKWEEFDSEPDAKGAQQKAPGMLRYTDPYLDRRSGKWMAATGYEQRLEQAGYAQKQVPPLADKGQREAVAKEVLAALDKRGPGYLSTAEMERAKEDIGVFVNGRKFGDSSDAIGNLEWLGGLIGGQPYNLNVWDAALQAGVDVRGETKAVYLNIRKPFDIDKGRLKVRDIPEDIRPRIISPIVLAYDREELENIELSYDTLHTGFDTHAQTNAFLQSIGYDGLTHIGGNRVGGGHEHRVWIAFEPNQIKSCDNRGTFDPKSLNIRESRVLWTWRNGAPRMAVELVSQSGARRIVTEEWDEERHPRGEGGKFAAGASGGESGDEDAICPVCHKPAGKAMGKATVYHGKCAYDAGKDAREATRRVNADRALPETDDPVKGMLDEWQNYREAFNAWFAGKASESASGWIVVGGIPRFVGESEWDEEEHPRGGAGRFVAKMQREEEPFQLSNAPRKPKGPKLETIGGKQKSLFDTRGLAGQMSLFDEPGAPKEMVNPVFREKLEPKETPAPTESTSGGATSAPDSGNSEAATMAPNPNSRGGYLKSLEEMRARIAAMTPDEYEQELRKDGRYGDRNLPEVKRKRALDDLDNKIKHHKEVDANIAKAVADKAKAADEERRMKAALANPNTDPVEFTLSEAEKAEFMKGMGWDKPEPKPAAPAPAAGGLSAQSIIDQSYAKLPEFRERAQQAVGYRAGDEDQARKDYVCREAHNNAKQLTEDEYVKLLRSADGRKDMAYGNCVRLLGRVTGLGNGRRAKELAARIFANISPTRFHKQHYSQNTNEMRPTAGVDVVNSMLPTEPVWRAIHRAVAGG